MRRKTPLRSSVEIVFARTRDGLVLDQIVLRPADAEAEKDLRRFLQRFRDPDVDLDAHAVREALDG